MFPTGYQSILAAKWSLGGPLLYRRPPKDNFAAASVCFMNPNQDNLIICWKLYLDINGPKDA